MKTVAIIGGGVSGLIASIILARRGIDCVVLEKKNYPFHRVCGEYISNEAVPFLKSMDLYPGTFDPPQFTRFELSAFDGKNKILPLGMGGFGISRYSFDHFLYLKAREAGVEFLLDTVVDDVKFLGNSFNVVTSREQISATIVLGSFGKRSNLDSRLDRNFMKSRSPYVGVKYHVQCEHPDDLISLHNFPGGYCGVSKVEKGIVNICYLVHRDKLRTSGSIPGLEAGVLSVNPLLKNLLGNAKPLFDKPEVINEISFESKSPTEDHILMIGDAAGMITPLCGNGIAMAIHSAKICCDHVIEFLAGTNPSRERLELAYAREWKSTFSRRLFKGRMIQKLFGSEKGSDLAVGLALHFRPIAMEIIRNTHGKPFK